MSVVALERKVTDTPLARRHAREVAAYVSGRTRAIAFDAFDASKYPDAALEVAAGAVRALAAGEYMAVDLFSKLAAALALAGAPIDIVSAATKVPCDEIRHADLALRMSAAFGDRAQPPRFDRNRHLMFGGPLDQERLDLAMIENPAIGESLACALLTASHRRATDPTLRSFYAALMRDEVHHARLGWYYLSWRAPSWSRAERQRIADWTGVYVMGLERMFLLGRDAPPKARRAARALGVLDSKAQREAIRAVIEEEIVPGLDALGLGASHAWRARPPISG